MGGSDLAGKRASSASGNRCIVRTSPISVKKPTPVEEADTIIDVFDNTLFTTIPKIYRRFDDWVLGEKAVTSSQFARRFSAYRKLIGSDRDGNPNVTAKVSRQVAAKFSAQYGFRFGGGMSHGGA